MGKEHDNNKETQFEINEKDAKIVRKVVLFTISFLVLFFAITGIIAYSYIKSALGAVDPKSKEKIELEIPLGSSSSEIANILEEHNIIKDKRIFRFYIKLKNEVDFQAGSYTLSPALTLSEIIQELQSGKVIEEPIYRVTIPEGKSLEEIAQIFSSKLSISADEFTEMADNQAFIGQLMEKYPVLLTDEILNKDIYVPLEGYLFAGTYDIFEEEPTVDELLTMMIDRTNEIFEEKAAEIEESEWTVHEILTLASIIERESKFPEDRPKVAQVYKNRLDTNMKLQSDITAFYGIKHKAVVTYEDIEVDTPYNTYVIDGLPVGPINSPSMEAIEAVFHPEGKEFEKLYYFSRPSGETFYSDTLEEHNRIKEQYRHEWYELENDKSEGEK